MFEKIIKKLKFGSCEIKNDVNAFKEAEKKQETETK